MMIRKGAGSHAGGEPATTCTVYGIAVQDIHLYNATLSCSMAFLRVANYRGQPISLTVKVHSI